MSRHRSARAPRPLRVVRFLVQVLIGVLVLTWAPTIAQAAFTGAATAALTVGTYKIPAPAAANVSVSCAALSTTMTVTVTNISAVDRATSYTLALTTQGGAPEGTPQTVTNPQSPTTIKVHRYLLTSPTYTLRIRANVNKWTGEDALVQTVRCS